MRDKNKGNNYFESYISNQKNRLNMFASKLENNEVGEDRIQPVKKWMFGIYCDTINAQYSHGADKTELRSELISSLSYAHQITEFSYFELIRTLSLSVLLDLQYDQVKMAISSISQDQLDDQLIQLLLSNWQERMATKNVRYPVPYNFLSGIEQMNKEKAIQHLKEYLQKFWYSGHKDMGWYDSHLDIEDDERNIYSGYWSFESAAICKILDLDANELSGFDFFPFDLV